MKKRKPLSEKRKAYQEQYRNDPKNKDRARKVRQARYRADPEKQIAAQRYRYYGLTPEAGVALFAGQNERCAICEATAPKGRGAWHLDHDHLTGQIRGFLCQQCNNGLGQFKDSPERLERAAQYLRKHAKGSVIH